MTVERPKFVTSIIFLFAILFAIPFLAYDRCEADVEALAAVEEEGGGGTTQTATNESLATLAKDPTAMARGKKIFSVKCYTCHGRLGEGGVGPNMTDAYAIHGHTAMDRLRVITEGVPARGMVAFKGQFSDEELQIMAAYVSTLRETTPPNPKPPQGRVAE